MVRQVGILSLIIILLGGCQKGEEDPTFSLKTRKGRLTGDWMLEAATWVRGDTMIEVSNNIMVMTVGSKTFEDVAYDARLEFEADGSYKISTEQTTPDNFGGVIGPGNTSLSEETGEWQFTGGNGNSKSKSMLVLLPSKFQYSPFVGSSLTITTFDGQSEATVYDLVKLTSKEIKMGYETTINDDLGTYTSSADLVLVPRDS